MKIKDYLGKNQEILDKWQKEFESRGGDSSKFCWDGLMFKGELYREEGTNNWIHDEGKDSIENKLWNEVKPRILYLTKDQNLRPGDDEVPAWDVRIESYHDSESNELITGSKFNRMLVYTLYGLAHTTPEKTVKFDDIDNHKALKFVDKFPFARINCKKEGGGSSCSNQVLRDAMEEYSTFLEEQINNLDADIFVCCGSTFSGYRIDKNNPTLDFLNHHGYHFEYAGDKSIDIYYDKEKNKVAIDSYHLSYTSEADKAMYDEMVKTYFTFLQAHPDFLKSIKR